MIIIIIINVLLEASLGNIPAPNILTFIVSHTFLLARSQFYCKVWCEQLNIQLLTKLRSNRPHINLIITQFHKQNTTLQIKRKSRHSSMVLWKKNVTSLLIVRSIHTEYN